jgi:hypothetical protein
MRRRAWAVWLLAGVLVVVGAGVAGSADAAGLVHATGSVRMVHAASGFTIPGVVDLDPIGTNGHTYIALDASSEVAASVTVDPAAVDPVVAAAFGPLNVGLSPLVGPFGLSGPGLGSRDTVLGDVSPDGSTVVGSFRPQDPTASYLIADLLHPARWRRATGWVPEDLGTIAQVRGQTDALCVPAIPTMAPQASLGRAWAVNDAGTVAGTATYRLADCWIDSGAHPRIETYYAHAYRLAAGGAMEDLGTLNDVPGGDGSDCAYSSALAINAGGDIVGVSGRHDWGGWGTTPNADCFETGPGYVFQFGVGLVPVPWRWHAVLVRAGGGRGAMVDLTPTNPAGGTGDYDRTEAVAINTKGQIAINAMDNSGFWHAYVRDADGTMHDIGTLGGGDTLVTSINSYGEAVGYSTDLAGDKHLFLWANGTTRSLDPIQPNHWTAFNRGTAITDAGDIAGIGVRDGVTVGFLMHTCALTPAQLRDAAVIRVLEDTDQDGIPDCWERYGVWVVQPDGTVKKVLTLPDAKVGRKDLYLEADHLAGYIPEAVTFPQVTAAFAAAPVTNADGSTGVSLHVEPGDRIPNPNVNGTVDIPNARPVGSPPGPVSGVPSLYWIEDGDTVPGSTCKGWFGTAEERALPDCADVLAARRAVYRYVLWAGHLALSEGATAGIAPIDGQAMMILKYGFPAALVDQLGGQVVFEPRTFMHEFGHSLGLHHGGGDEVNCKPNYQSIMNYTYPDLPAAVGAPFPLDYSGTSGVHLDEGALGEPAGLGLPQWDRAVLGVGGILSIRPVSLLGGIDWNGNGTTTDVGVSEPVSWVDTEPGCDAAHASNGLVDGRWVRILFNPLNLSAVPPAGQFVVQVNGVRDAVLEPVRLVEAASLSALSFQLARPVGPADAVTVIYRGGLVRATGAVVPAGSFILTNLTGHRPGLDGYDDWANLTYSFDVPQVGFAGPRGLAHAAAGGTIEPEPTARQVAATVEAAQMYTRVAGAPDVRLSALKVARKGRVITTTFRLSTGATLWADLWLGKRIAVAGGAALRLKGANALRLTLPKRARHGTYRVRIAVWANGRRVVVSKSIRY